MTEITSIKKLFKQPFLSWIFIILFFYIVLNVLISGFYKTFQLILRYSSTVNWFKLGFSLILTLAIGLLVSMNIVLWIIRYQERKRCASGKTLATIGTVGGLVTGVCPLCIVGLIPLILSALGITFSFASLPFGGIEVQVLVVIILLASLKLLSKTKYRDSP